MTILLGIFATLLAAVSIVSADSRVYGPEDADSYDNGTYGRTPEEKFHSVDIPAYRLLRRKWDAERCQSNDKLFLGIRGKRLWHTGPVIYDNDGHQVWYAEGVKTPYNVRMQRYKGNQYITWWSGDDEGGHGSGYYYMYDHHYQLFKRVEAYGNYSADMHEFFITEKGTALLTVYDRQYVDLSRYGVTEEAESYIADCLFQEIDLETNELIFEWRASDHFSFEDCFNPHPNRTGMPSGPTTPPPPASGNDDDHPATLVRKPRAWDWFHINSVTKDHIGNYLISSRYTHSLSYISHLDGSVQWQLGGKNNDFEDISEPPFAGYATSLAWQHHVQFDAHEPNVLLVFDNQAVNWNKTLAARVLKIQLDTEARTAKVIAAAEHPREYIVPSQGSVQQLASGNLFVGYGFASAMTEFSPDGSEVLCDWQYGALHAKLDGEYSAGIIQSYRAFKQPWKGWPLDVPTVKILESDTQLYGAFANNQEEDIDVSLPSETEAALLTLQSKQTKMHVSWNGATEVRTWTLERRLLATDGAPTSTLTSEPYAGDSTEPEASRLNASGWSLVDTTPKQGFESTLSIPLYSELLIHVNQSTYGVWQTLKQTTEYRLRALDAGEKLLGLWHIDSENHVSALPYKQDDESDAQHPYLPRSHTVAGLVGLAICAIFFYLWPRRRRLRWRYWNVPGFASDKEKGEEAATLIQPDVDASTTGNGADHDQWHGADRETTLAVR